MLLGQGQAIALSNVLVIQCSRHALSGFLSWSQLQFCFLFLTRREIDFLCVWQLLISCFALDCCILASPPLFFFSVLRAPWCFMCFHSHITLFCNLGLSLCVYVSIQSAAGTPQTLWQNRTSLRCWSWSFWQMGSGGRKRSRGGKKSKNLTNIVLHLVIKFISAHNELH